MLGKKGYESEYPATRRKRARRVFWYWILGVTFLIVILIGCAYGVLRGSWFKVRDFKVEGSREVSREELVSALSIRMLTVPWRGWIGPNNILFWEFGSVPERLERYPNLKNIAVVSRFFSRNVDILVEERKPHGILCELSETRCYLMDDEGVLYASAPSTEGTLILTIHDKNQRVPLLGIPFLPDYSWIQNMFLTLNTLKDEGFIPLRVTLDDLSLRAWSAEIAEGPTLLFALDFVPENLNSVLRSLSNKLDFSKVRSVDLQVPNRIYYQ